MRSRLAASVVVLSLASVLGCQTGETAKHEPPAAEPAKPVETAAPAPTEGVLRLGAAIEAKDAPVLLGEVAKKPDAYVGKTFTTTGTVSAVCQHMGCWMEIKDEASAAHIKMAGHAFFVPKTASGRKARVKATLVKADDPKPACEGGGHGKGGGCKAEAESQLGRPLAKLELVAEGVELL